eukprot:CAMPEP_0172491894 /NCGR_PEP_ID=MMETSP1066-20121228/22817_1 /TAXON_ID=671091 /ORGANISM="Coscinodiscus wailesii, Strain CCMP2513" /LENGTH=416 /DNA_ID=CAMNT_0013261189 /DNA_START=108 /DNA_END=1358 /DNA_ORIENTATION=-
MRSNHHTSLTTSLLVLGGALAGSLTTYIFLSRKRVKNQPDPETDHQVTRTLIWNCVGNALSASLLYIGDKLKLYKTLSECCAEDGSFVTSTQLSSETGLNERWLREWLAHQASVGIIQLLPPASSASDDERQTESDSSLRYRLPKAAAEVLSDPASKHYDISMVQLVPSLVRRSQSMLPEAFRTGQGRAYDEADVAEAINRQHDRQIRDIVIPEVVNVALNGGVKTMLDGGAEVADLGCGAAGLMLALAKEYPSSRYHGFEVSKVALDQAAYNVAKNRVSNVFLHDATEEGESLGDFEWRFDVILTFDVLHDAAKPEDLIRQARRALKPKTGVWLLADIPSKDTLRENITDMQNPATYFAFSLCLCMSCSLSEEGGSGLGTLGFRVPIAKQMLKEGGFESVDILLEKDNMRWFVVR